MTATVRSKITVYVSIHTNDEWVEIGDYNNDTYEELEIKDIIGYKIYLTDSYSNITSVKFVATNISNNDGIESFTSFNQVSNNYRRSRGRFVEHFENINSQIESLELELEAAMEEKEKDLYLKLLKKD